MEESSYGRLIHMDGEPVWESLLSKDSSVKYSVLLEGLELCGAFAVKYTLAPIFKKA